MSKKRASSPKQDSSSTPVEFDPRPEAALTLGFTSRTGEYADANCSILKIFEDVPKETRSAFQWIVNEMERQYKDYEEFSQELDWDEEDVKWSPDENHRRILCGLADRVFPDGHYLLPWYVLGTVLGDTAFRLERRPGAKVDVHAIITAVQSLPEKVIEQIEILKKLSALDASRPDARNRFQEVLRSTSVIGPSSATTKLDDEDFAVLCSRIILDPKFAAVGTSQAPFGRKAGRKPRSNAGQGSFGRPAKPGKPKWDPKKRLLTVDGVVVKDLRKQREGGHQEQLISEFQQQKWKCQIENPFGVTGVGPNRHLLRQTVKSFNRRQKNSLLKFFVNPSATLVSWEHLPVVEDQ